MKAFVLLALVLSINIFASTGEPLSKWNKLAITVCWLDDQAIQESDYAMASLRAINELESNFIKASDQLKLAVKTSVEKEYTHARTGIHFVGWKSCKSTKSYDAQILVGNENQGYAGKASQGRLTDFNYSYDRMSDSQKGYVYLSTRVNNKIKITHTESVVNTALHEFGHLAGLRHEHIRNQNDNNHRSDEPMTDETSFFSVYDPSSVMNYIFSGFVELETGLNFYGRKDSYLGRVPNPKLPILSYDKLKKYTDKTIFSSRPISDGLDQYQLKLGLSKGDLHGLKCMYVYSRLTAKLKCHKYARP